MEWKERSLLKVHSSYLKSRKKIERERPPKNLSSSEIKLNLLGLQKFALNREFDLKKII